MNGSPWERGEPSPADQIDNLRARMNPPNYAETRSRGYSTAARLLIFMHHRIDYRIALKKTGVSIRPGDCSATRAQVGTSPPRARDGRKLALSAYPIGSADLGYVDSMDVAHTRLQNMVRDCGPLTRPATNDEILAAYGGSP